MRLFKWSAGLALTCMLVACGGGGGNPGSSGGGNGGGGTTPTPTPTPTPTVAVTIRNASNAAVNSISFGGAFTVQARVTDASGAAVSQRLVTFALSGASIAVLADPPTALTNAAGIAEVSIAPSSVAATGAASVSATANVGTSVMGRVDFAVATSNLSLSPIALGLTNLPSGGNTSVSVTALVGSAPFTAAPVNVSYSVSCGRINGMTTSFGATTNGSGIAAVTYTAVEVDGSLCTGAVTVTAATPGAAARMATINVAAPVANAVTFVSAIPAQIFIAGSGAQEQSVVRFRVLSSAGTPLSNVGVVFTIQSNPVGVGIGLANSTAPVSATTNASGEASVAIFSGSAPGPIRVRAALAATPSIFAESQNLTVASGPPSQRFMSLSVSTFNIEGLDRDGTSTTLTARLADRQGNQVDDGTVVNFTAEGGQVVQSCSTTRVAGISQCSVNFQSQNPRPVGGRVSVLAYTNGTKDFTDGASGTINRYDGQPPDTLLNIGDAYRDDNENNAFDNGEFVLSRGGQVVCPGSGGPFPGRVNTCDNPNSPATALTTTVRQQAVILFSSSTPVLSVLSRGPTGITFRLRSSVNTLLPMPAGTTLSATASGGTCAVMGGVQGTPVVNVQPGNNPNADLATFHAVDLMGCAAGNNVRITVTSPAGLATIINVGL